MIELEHSLGKEKMSLSESNRFRHSKDESSHPPIEPDIVLFP